jgi:hypothetical protein
MSINNIFVTDGNGMVWDGNEYAQKTKIELERSGLKVDIINLFKKNEIMLTVSCGGKVTTGKLHRGENDEKEFLAAFGITKCEVSEKRLKKSQILLSFGAPLIMQQG